MAFAGLRKQINKANQYVTEKMGGAEGTKLDLDFVEMERKTDVTCELVEELQTKTKEFLQPNPTARAKMAAVKGISKLSGQAKSNTYPQPEGVLGDCMLLYGKKLGEDSIFAQCMVEMGESLKQMADVKYSLDDNIKQSFLEPLHHLQTKDLKEVMHHRKKLQGRRLDYDCKRRRQAKVFGHVSPYSSPSHGANAPRQGSHIPDEEIRQAEEKFAESLHLAQVGMFNLLDSDVEQVAQLTFFAEGLLEYHQQCTEILKVLVSNLLEKKEEAANRPKLEFVPKTLADLNIEGVHDFNGRRFGSASNLSRTRLSHQRPPSSSVGDLSTADPLTAWDHALKHPQPTNGWPSTHKANVYPKIMPPPNAHRPNPAPRSLNGGRDPWTGGSRMGSPEHKPPSHLELAPGNNSNTQRSNNASPLPSPMKSPARTPLAPAKASAPCCTALYDFEPENQGELGFKENDVITLIQRVDDNWYEGTVNGRTGYFPVSYVQVTVPLPE